VFQNGILRTIYGSKVDIRCWRKGHIEEFHNLYSSLNSIRIIKEGLGGCAMSYVWEREDKHEQCLVSELEGKRQFGRLIYKLVPNIKTVLIKYDTDLRTGFMWLRIGTVFGFHKRLGISRLAERANRHTKEIGLHVGKQSPNLI
jgi:hypothetical protein